MLLDDIEEVCTHPTELEDSLKMFDCKNSKTINTLDTLLSKFFSIKIIYRHLHNKENNTKNQ